MSKIFISYAHENEAAAEVLYAALEEWGHNVWMDVHRLEPGRSWVRDIDAALRDSEMVVGLLTPEGLDSPNVTAEWFWALENDRKLILMRHADFSREKISHKLIHLQWIDYHKDEGEGFGRLRSVVEKDTPLDEVAAGSISPLQPKSIAKARWLQGKAPVNSNRERMLQRVYAYWVEGFLNQAVKEANQFNIGYELAPDAVLKHVNYSDCRLPADTDFGQVFKHLGAEVLILGTPGSGKTILLLQLAEQLLAKAALDEQAPIPIVLNLSSWSHKREPLHEWIVNEAAMSYQVPRRAIRRWVEEEAVVPLLDGLDEVLPEYREACVDVINHFHRTYRGVELSVCSRIGDYELLQTKIDFRSAILIQPLDECQVHAVTSRPELDALRETMEKEPALVEMSHTPYLLNVMSYAYADKSESELRLPAADTDEEARRAHMLDSYINRRLGETRGKRLMSAQRMRSLLAWLAFNMTQRGQIVFHIESLQMDWLTRFRDRWLYCFLSRTLFGLVGLGIIWVGVWSIGCVAFLLVSWVRGTPLEQVYHTIGMFGIPTLIVLFISLWIFYLAGLCAASIEWVRSTHSMLIKTRMITWIISHTLVGLVLGICLSFVVLVFKVLNGLIVFSFEELNMKLAKNLFDLVWELTFFQAIQSVTCSVCAIFCNRLKVQSLMPTYAVFGVVLPYVLVGFIEKRLLPTDKITIIFYTLGYAIILAFALSMTSLFGDQIQTAERIQWRWNARVAKFWLAPWLALDVIGLLILSFLMLKDGAPNSEEWWLPFLLFGCGLIPTIFSGVFGGTMFGFQRAEGIQRRLVPNEGVFRSVRMGVLFSTGFGVASFLFCMAITGLYYWFAANIEFMREIMNAIVPCLFISAFPAAIGAMLGGFDVPVKHIVLRALLTIGEAKPFWLRRFLDVCTSQLMLRRVGGGYIFVHRYLLEHFARIHREVEAKELSKR